MKSIVVAILLVASPALAQCPPGYAATPAGCVVQAPRPAVAAGAQRGWPTAPLGRPDGVVNPRVAEGFDMGLILAGAITFGVGYLTTVLTGIVADATSPCGYGYTSYSACNAWPLALIPLGGAMLNGLGRGSTGYALGFGIPVTTAQLVGFSLVAHALVFRTSDVAPGASLSFAPVASGADVGMTFGGRFH
ncbi:MAG: hypothetical protein IT378_16880 [Sandaracinaceae bacterium]|nr:hypothetical protein [Sandaracinaceae bacterium]